MSSLGDEYMSSLGDEYKILQDKIDKIGAFRVTIKGWSVTATIGGLVAIVSGKGFSPATIALALDVLLACFFLFERQQVGLEWAFSGRARNIEIQIDKRRRAIGQKVLFSTPNIARSLSGVKKRRDFIRHSFDKRTPERWRLRANKQIRLAIGSGLIFYVGFGLASWIPKWMGATVQSTTTPIVIQNTIQVPTLSAPASEPAIGRSVPHAQVRRPKGGAS